MNFFKLLLKYHVFEIFGFSFLILGTLIFALIQYSKTDIQNLNNEINDELLVVQKNQSTDLPEDDKSENNNQIKIDAGIIVNQDEDNTDPYADLPTNFQIYQKSIFDIFEDKTPKSIMIKEIGLKSQINELDIVDLGDSSSYETPKNVVGYIPESVKPGEKGKSWYFGHLESFIKKEGKVFHMLPKIPELMQFDPYIFVHIETNSKTFVYQIHKTEVIPKDDLVLEIDAESPEIVLVTCVPSFLYHSRLLVHAKLIGEY